MVKSIKEQVVDEAIQRCKTRLEEIKTILNSNPLSDIIQLRTSGIEKAKELSREGKHEECSIFLKECIKKETELFELADYQSNNTLVLIDERVALETQLADLTTELYWIAQKKG